MLFNVHIHTRTHSRTHAHTHTHARTHARTHTHPPTHARTHARTHAHTHTHTHTHTHNKCLAFAHTFMKTNLGRLNRNVKTSPLTRAGAQARRLFIDARRLSAGAVSHVYDCCFKGFDEDIKPDASNYSYKLLQC